MSVKEILQGLVDDGMVDTDKIGTSVYFWAFPSKAGQNVILSHFIYISTKIHCHWNYDVYAQSMLQKYGLMLLVVSYFMHSV